MIGLVCARVCPLNEIALFSSSALLVDIISLFSQIDSFFQPNALVISHIYGSNRALAWPRAAFILSCAVLRLPAF